MDGAHSFWFGFPKKMSDVDFAHRPVLDDNFPQDGTITIFIVAVT